MTFVVTAFHSKYGNFEESYKMQSTAKSQKQHLESSGYKDVKITRISS